MRAVAVAAALSFVGVFVATALVARSQQSYSSSDVRAIDGDTLVARLGLQRIHLRLNGIDSPELPGHCHGNRHCAPGDPYAAKANAARLIAGQTVRWADLGRDRYGRTIAEVYVGGVDLSCAQLRGGFAIYKPRWDNEKLLVRTCR